MEDMMSRIITERRGEQRVYRLEGRSDRRPTHPGEILREDVLPAVGISVAQAARDLRVSRQYLHKILRGEVPITVDMAVKLGKLVGNGPGLWLRMQQAHDLWHAERRLAPELKKIPTRPAAA
jgi:addiction module HigA family antidote